MGLIKSIFGGIFGLIGGIFGGIAKLLGLGKKGEFYMELAEGEQSTPAAQPVSVAKAPEKAAASPASAEAPAAKPKATPVASVSPDKPLVTANPQAAAQAAAAERNFATDYLVNPQVNNAPRRRPGPSVSPFKDMARSMGRKSPSMG